jgi:tRNA splicing endonuclease
MKEKEDEQKILRIIKAAELFFENYEKIEEVVLDWAPWDNIEEKLPSYFKKNGFLKQEYRELDSALENARLTLYRSKLGMTADKIINDIKYFANEIASDENLTFFEKHLQTGAEIPDELTFYNTRQMFRLGRMQVAATLDAHIKDIINGSGIEINPADVMEHNAQTENYKKDQTFTPEELEIFKECFGSENVSLSEDESSYLLRYQLFLYAQTYYQLVESVATGYVGWMDYKINHYYLLLVKNIKFLLDAPELKTFPAQFNPVVENLFPSCGIDIVWDCGAKEQVEDFVGQTQSYFSELNHIRFHKSETIQRCIKFFQKNVEQSLKAATEHSAKAEKGFEMMVNKIKAEQKQQTNKQNSGRQNIKLKTNHKNLIKAFSQILSSGNNSEITRDFVVGKSGYSVGSGAANQAYKDLKEWGIITQDGQNFTSEFQCYKQNPPR